MYKAICVTSSKTLFSTVRQNIIPSMTKQFLLGCIPSKWVGRRNFCTLTVSTLSHFRYSKDFFPEVNTHKRKAPITMMPRTVSTISYHNNNNNNN